MMCIPSTVEVSDVHGLGIFVFTRIPSGTALWRFMAGDQRVPLAEANDRQKHYGYVNPRRNDALVVCGDHSRFWNFAHGVPANAVEGQVDDSGEAVIIAARDILPGEELLIDQATDADFARKMGAN